ncbi:MAG: hypothetical protein VKL20_06335 [Synechocystis sp.]|nr:hypothetical protein [Synechocystis sp.]
MSTSNLSNVNEASEKKIYNSPKLQRLGSVEKVQAFVQGKTTESATSGVYDRTIL